MTGWPARCRKLIDFFADSIGLLSMCGRLEFLLLDCLCVFFKLFMSVFHSGVANGGGARGPGPPILQTKHKHTFKLHEIDQFGEFKIIKIVATRSHF